MIGRIGITDEQRMALLTGLVRVDLNNPFGA
jgi:hypothetical protein